MTFKIRYHLYKNKYYYKIRKQNLLTSQGNIPSFTNLFERGDRLLKKRKLKAIYQKIDLIREALNIPKGRN